jgi:hypothetical protein
MRNSIIYVCMRRFERRAERRSIVLRSIACICKQAATAAFQWYGFVYYINFLGVMYV